MYDKIRTDVKIRLIAEKKFLGPGVCELLEYIEKCGSIQAGCKEMGLSYSKGSHILKNLENGFDTPIVERWTGGKSGGGARLTEEGKEVVKRYREMAADIEEYARKAYESYFGDMLGELCE